MLASATYAQAGFIDLTSYAGQPANGGAGTILQWAKDAVSGKPTSYNTLVNPDLPLVSASAFRNNQGDNNNPPYPVFGNNVTSLDIPVGDFEYIALHWGGGGQKDQYPNYEFWYIGDPMGATEFTAMNKDQHGLSWYELFNPITKPNPNPGPGVPDSGTTLALFGASIILIAALRRRIR